jgi:hypothetical protein
LLDQGNPDGPETAVLARRSIFHTCGASAWPATGRGCRGARASGGPGRPVPGALRRGRDRLRRLPRGRRAAVQCRASVRGDDGEPWRLRDEPQMVSSSPGSIQTTTTKKACWPPPPQGSADVLALGRGDPAFAESRRHRLTVRSWLLWPTAARTRKTCPGLFACLCDGPGGVINVGARPRRPALPSCQRGVLGE